MPQPHAQLVTAKLNKLHPTQVTVGKLEVALKRNEWAALGKKSREAALSSHWFPAITGPEQEYYIVDHHHFGLALLEEDVKTVSVMVLSDLSWLSLPRFWSVMDHHQWVHSYDAEGVRRDFGAIPYHLSEMQDDPYRSLAGQLRRVGGFAKDVTPFSEFLWADFLRDHVPLDLIVRDYDKALAKATNIASSHEARYLPGWHGVIQSV